MDEMSLSRRERAFCRAYVKLWNGREAALAAGYKPRLAGLRAEKILLKPAAQQEVCLLLFATKKIRLYLSLCPSIAFFCLTSAEI